MGFARLGTPGASRVRRAVDGTRSSGSSRKLGDPHKNSVADGDIDKGVRDPGRAGVNVQDSFFKFEVN